ncbi:MAG TPA: 50S ribosomal protein L11 methyltransferase [Chitinophagaceae bacterium]|nr:50S ribosomal protein L11 methyltransferase [Chitinophagaceae bacterium]
MKIYSELVFAGVTQELQEILIARLSEAGYDGFLEEGDTLKAYRGEEPLDEDFLRELCVENGCSYTVNKIQEENWNASWEASFSPVVVENFVAVRADFHEVVKDVEHEIIITPKMSFGTGHHATTWLMMKALRDLSLQGTSLQGTSLQGRAFQEASNLGNPLQQGTLENHSLQGASLQGRPLGGREVLDFGTGTGILAILAEKMGAGHVLAIDNDTWSIDNATENIARNNSQKIDLALADSIPPGRQFDIVLANINKHILLEHARSIADSVRMGGILIISGILSEDKQDMISAFDLYLIRPINAEERNNWLMMAFSKGDANHG